MSDALALIVDLVRTGRASTAQELSGETGLNRRRIGQLVEQALDLGLLCGEAEPGHTPARLRFKHERGRFAVVSFGALDLDFALTDLSGTVLASGREGWDATPGPVASLGYAFSRLEALIAADPAPVWGIAIGVPEAADWNSLETAVAAARFEAAVCVHTGIGLEALGELALRPEQNEGLLYVTVGARLSAVLVARREGGSIVNRTIENLSSAEGNLLRSAETAARERRSDFLGARLAEAGLLRPGDVADGAERGDPECRRLLVMSAQDAGEAIARMVTTLNPASVVVGGSVARNPDFLATVRATVYRHSLPQATRDLEIAPAAGGSSSAFHGGVEALKRRVFGPKMATWIREGCPLGTVSEPSAGKAAEADHSLA